MTHRSAANLFLSMHYFIHGPSGSGKSYVAKKLADAKNALHIEIDLWPPRDGIEEHGLNPQWDSFYRSCDFGPLNAELTRRAADVGASGCVLSLPGFPILRVGHAERTSGQAKIIYLIGTPGQCLDSFLVREKETGRNLDMVHWANNSVRFFPELQRADIQPLCLPCFDANSRRRATADIIRDIDSR